MQQNDLHAVRHVCKLTHLADGPLGRDRHAADTEVQARHHFVLDHGDGVGSARGGECLRGARLEHLTHVKRTGADVDERIIAFGVGHRRRFVGCDGHGPVVKAAAVDEERVVDLERPHAVGVFTVKSAERVGGPECAVERWRTGRDRKDRLIIERGDGEVIAAAPDAAEQHHARALGADHGDGQVRVVRVLDVHGDVHVGAGAVQSADRQV